MIRVRWLMAWVLCCVAHAALGAVTVTDVWARATPPGTTVGVVYARIVADAPDELISVTSGVADRVEIHASTSDDGTVRMRPMGAVPLRAGQPVVLGPGGIHVMLIGLRRPLQAGSSFELTLTFRSAPPLTVSAKIIGPGGAAPAH